MRRLVLLVVALVLGVATPVGADVGLDNRQVGRFGVGVAGTRVHEYGTGTDHVADTASEFAAGTITGTGIVEGDAVVADEQWWNDDYDERVCRTVTGSSGLAAYPVRVVIDTSTSTGIEGLRVVPHTDPADAAVPLPVYVESGFGTPSTVVWFRTPLTGGGQTFCFYSDGPDPSMSSELAVFDFTGTGQVVRYFAMNTKYDGSGGTNGQAAVTAYVDGTVVSFNGSSYTIDAGVTQVLSGVTVDSVVTSTAPVDISGVAEGTDSFVPEAFADHTFSFPTERYTEVFTVRSPFGSTSIQVLINGAVVDTVPVTPAASTIRLPYDGGATFVTLRSVDGTDFLAVHEPDNHQDVFPGVPWFGDTLYGVASEQLYVGSDTFQNVSWVRQGGATGTFAIGPDDTDIVSGNGPGRGNGLAYALTGSSRFAAIQQRDDNGTESTSFLPARLLSRTFRMPVTASYITVACPTPGTTISFNGGAAQACNGAGVGNWWTGVGTYAAGTSIEASAPVFTFFESRTGADERNVYGPKAHIPYLRSSADTAFTFDPCFVWESPVFPVAGVMGLTESDAVGVDGVRVEVAFDGGAYGPLPTPFLDYSIDGASTARLRVEACGADRRLDAVGFESDLPESDGVSTATTDGPLLRVYPAFAGWNQVVAGAHTGVDTFDLGTDAGSDQVVATGGVLTSPSPAFVATAYSIDLDDLTPQTATLELEIRSEGSGVAVTNLHEVRITS